MFGGPLERPKYVKRSRPKPMTYDIQLPSVKPGVYGHLGRAPNTDYHIHWLHYRQRLADAEIRIFEEEAQRLKKDKTVAKYDKHNEKVIFQKRINERFKEKVKSYEECIEKRRQKLRELLCQEEKEYIEETIDQSQRGISSKMDEMKMSALRLKARREEERVKIADERRMMQYIKDCKELRPVVIKVNLVDTKNTQLQQIKENEMRREAEKELDKMWYNLMMKEQEAKVDLEVQDLLKMNKSQKEMMETWEKQIQGKQVLREEANRIAAEDRVEMVKLQEQIRREKIEALDAKRRKRDQVSRELREQLLVQEKYIAQRQKEEEILSKALSQIAQNEQEREMAKIRNTTQVMRREMAIYRQHIRELEEERKKEDEQLHRLLNEHKKIIEQKQEDAYCKLKKAKDDLQRNVLAERAQQLEYKRQEAESRLKLKEAENELVRMASEMNERLQAETDRLQAEQVKQYREDLKKQIEDNNEKRKREKEQLERELAESLAEEERRQKDVLQLITAYQDGQTYKHQHPFRRVLDRQPCPCPIPTDKQ